MALMLKISIIEGHSRCCLIVEGKLVGPWASELKIACEKAKAGLHGRELMLDLKQLTAISQEGENLLLELMSNGIKFRCRGVFTKHVLKQISRRVNMAARGTNR
jgi:hypothetical protein